MNINGTALNYQTFGTPNKRLTAICKLHKARSLVNAYYWNRIYKLNNIDDRMKINLSKEDCLDIIDENEYGMLIELSI